VTVCFHFEACCFLQAPSSRVSRVSVCSDGSACREAAPLLSPAAAPSGGTPPPRPAPCLSACVSRARSAGVRLFLPAVWGRVPRRRWLQEPVRSSRVPGARPGRGTALRPRALGAAAARAPRCAAVNAVLSVLTEGQARHLQLRQRVHPAAGGAHAHGQTLHHELGPERVCWILLH